MKLVRSASGVTDTRFSNNVTTIAALSAPASRAQGSSHQTEGETEVSSG